MPRKKKLLKVQIEGAAQITLVAVELEKCGQLGSRALEVWRQTQEDVHVGKMAGSCL